MDIVTPPSVHSSVRPSVRPYSWVTLVGYLRLPKILNPTIIHSLKCPSVNPSIILSPPQLLDEIQPNLVCELLHMNGACNSKHFLVPPPGLGEMLKGQISLNYNNKINFKDFIPKIACCLTDKRYKTCQTRFLSWCLGHTPEDLRASGCPGDKNDLHMTVWHIKLTGMVSRTECK